MFDDTGVLLVIDDTSVLVVDASGGSAVVAAAVAAVVAGVLASLDETTCTSTMVSSSMVNSSSRSSISFSVECSCTVLVLVVGVGCVVVDEDDDIVVVESDELVGFVALSRARSFRYLIRSSSSSIDAAWWLYNTEREIERVDDQTPPSLSLYHAHAQKDREPERSVAGAEPMVCAVEGE